jgi:hypothetical protein
MLFTMQMWSFEDRSAVFVDVFKRSAIAHGYDLRLIAPGDEPPTGFARLKSRYRHLSPNSERFELASFRRWFEVARRVGPSDRFIVADSDLVIGQSFTALPSEVRDFGGLLGSIGTSSGVLEDGISGGFSIWTGRQLCDFCDYMVTSYESGVDRLAALHAGKVSMGNARASISDMTLLYLWVQAANIPFFNTNRLLRDGQGRSLYIDHNFLMPEALDARFSMTLGRKSVRWHNRELQLRTAEGETVRAASLHLCGRYKIMARDLERRNQCGLALKSIYILGGRTGRALLARAGVHV